MNTAQLECFISLAGTLNYVKTSEALGLSQPAVTKQIQSLETELGCRLFNRTTRSVSLTNVGTAFLADANTMIDTYYRSIDRISGFQEKERHALRIGYMDSHTINHVSQILRPVLLSHPNIIPEFVQNQTDANLHHLIHNELDLIIGMKDARFQDTEIQFSKLSEEYFLCVMSRDFPLARKLLSSSQDSVSTKELWEYRQVLAIPPYLLKNFFSRGHHIVPVNENVDNAICSNAGEAYALLLAGFGYAYLPAHEIIEHKDLLCFSWTESPHAPFGIYAKSLILKDRSSAEYAFLQNAKELYKA